MIHPARASLYTSCPAESKQEKEALWKITLVGVRSGTVTLLRVIGVILVFKLVAGARGHFIHTYKH